MWIHIFKNYISYYIQSINIFSLEFLIIKETVLELDKLKNALCPSDTAQLCRSYSAIHNDDWWFSGWPCLLPKSVGAHQPSGVFFCLPDYIIHKQWIINKILSFNIKFWFYSTLFYIWLPILERMSKICIQSYVVDIVDNWSLYYDIVSMYTQNSENC